MNNPGLGLKVLKPRDSDVLTEMQRIVHEEISRDLTVASSQAFMVGVLEQLIAEGAEGVILGCTEFPALLASVDHSVPVFDSLEIHAEAATRFLLSG